MEKTMAYSRIQLNFTKMDGAYKDHVSLPADIKTWLKNQNDYEDRENDRRRRENILPLLGHSTSCCMQASLSFNATSQPIPKSGSRDRENTTLNGKNYILAVDEFRAYLTHKYGPTEQVSDLASIKGRTGVLIYGNLHMEFWDGDNIFQSSGGATRRRGNPAGVMAGGILGTRPLWFWEIDDAAPAESALVPEWVQGWWAVYDGNQYYYFFSHDGIVNFIKTKPNPKWKPPKTIGNQGKVTMVTNGLSVLWRPTEPGGVATKEDFTRVNWTSTTEMNGVSNKYSPLFARKM
jgi:hypothetical protein